MRSIKCQKSKRKLSMLQIRGNYEVRFIQSIRDCNVKTMLHVIKEIANRTEVTGMLVLWFVCLLFIMMLFPTADITNMQLLLAKISRDTADLYKHGGE